MEAGRRHLSSTRRVNVPPEVESNRGGEGGSLHPLSKRERSQVDKQTPRVSLQKSKAGKRYRAWPGVPVGACRMNLEAEAGRSLKFPAQPGLQTNKTVLNKQNQRAGKADPQGKMSAAKSDSPSLIPETHLVEGVTVHKLSSALHT